MGGDLLSRPLKGLGNPAEVVPIRISLAHLHRVVVGAPGASLGGLGPPLFLVARCARGAQLHLGPSRRAHEPRLEAPR